MNAPASDPSLALRLQRDRLREYLPHLWEGFSLGRLELVEVELKRFFSAIHELHRFEHKGEQAAHARHLQDRAHWESMDQALTGGIPGLVASLSGPVSDLESGFMAESDPELRSRLAFCLGGLRRFKSPSSKPPLVPAPETFPEEKQGSELDEVAHIVADLKRKTGAPHTPAELLGRIEIACAGRWLAHTEQIKRLRQITHEAALRADAARKTVETTLTQRFFPVLDTMESLLPMLQNAGIERPWSGTLRAAGTLLLGYLAERETVPLDVQEGVAFNPDWHSCGWVGHSLKPAPRIVTQMLRRGYLVKNEVVRLAEVETVLA